MIKKVLFVLFFCLSISGFSQTSDYAKLTVQLFDNLTEKSWSKVGKETKDEFIGALKSSNSLKSLMSYLEKSKQLIHKKAKEKQFENLTFSANNFNELGDFLFQFESSLKYSSFKDTWDDEKQEWKSSIINLGEIQLMKVEEVKVDTTLLIKEFKFALAKAQSKFKDGTKKVMLNASTDSYYKDKNEEKILTFFYDAGNFKENAFKLLTQLLNAADKIKPKGYKKTDFIGDSDYFEVSSYNFEYIGKDFSETAKRAIITIGVQEMDGKFRVIVSFSAPLF